MHNEIPHNLREHYRQLLDEWLDGQRPTDAAAALSAGTGTSVSLSRLGEWRNGVRPVPAHIVGFLLSDKR